MNFPAFYLIHVLVLHLINLYFHSIKFSTNELMILYQFTTLDSTVHIELPNGFIVDFPIN